MVRREGGGIQQLREILKQVEKATLAVGFPQAAQYQNGAQVAMIAAQNEFGNASNGIPPRPFMRMTIAREQNNIKQFMEKGSKAVLQGRFTIIQIYDQIGLKVAGEIRRTISELTSPALAPSTIRARQAKYASNQSTVGGLTKPLVETGLMINSVSHEVTTNANPS